MLPCGWAALGATLWTSPPPHRALPRLCARPRNSILRCCELVLSTSQPCRGQRYTSGVASRARPTTRTHVHRPPPLPPTRAWTGATSTSRFALQAVHGLAAWFDVEFLGYRPTHPLHSPRRPSPTHAVSRVSRALPNVWPFFGHRCLRGRLVRDSATWDRCWWRPPAASWRRTRPRIAAAPTIIECRALRR